MKKRTRRILVSVLLLLLLALAAGFVWLTRTYPADATARAILDQPNVTQLEDGIVRVSGEADSDTALIFYPGARVEYIAYLPLLDQIAQDNGITVFLTHMPLNMAIFDSSRADEVMTLYPQYENWYMGGHSLGGAMASRYAAENPGKVDGLILMGAYIYGDYPPEDTLTLYGSLEDVVKEKITYMENVVEIEGGNHAQFGNYGRQSGDPDAVITREQQQEIAVGAVKDFLASRED